MADKKLSRFLPKAEQKRLGTQTKKDKEKEKALDKFEKEHLPPAEKAKKEPAPTPAAPVAAPLPVAKKKEPVASSQTTSLRINPVIWKEAKKRCVDMGETLTGMVERLLSAELSKKPK